ncbi:MAG TPA: 30S ribosomal protein S6 [Elusimicrobiales bacterium]|nr:30S ribosomal protein S6 [Elusimicrobiales bacterium]
MNTYELILVVNPQASEAEVNEFIDKAKKILTDEKAEILNEDRLGRKKFTHNMGKHRDGFYVFMKVKADPAAVKAISHNLRLQEAILRSVIFKASVEKPVVKKA